MNENDFNDLKNCKGEVWAYLNEYETNSLFYMVDDGYNEYINFKVASTYSNNDGLLAMLGMLNSFNNLVKLVSKYEIDIEVMAGTMYYEELIDMWVSFPEPIKEYALDEDRLIQHLNETGQETLCDVQWYLHQIINELDEIVNNV